MGSKSSRSMWADKLAGKPGKVAKSLDVNTYRKPMFKGTVLGIDPSLRGTGLALMTFKGPQDFILHKSQTVRLSKLLSMPECLGEISRAVTEMLEFCEVRHVALEETIYVQNAQTAQIMGAAKGAAIAAAALKGYPIFQYAPLRIKQAVVGHGRASKEQMSRIIMNYLNQSSYLPSDEADAAGVAFCHAFTWRE